MQCSRSVKWHDAHKNAEQQKQLLFSRHQWSLPTEGVWGELKVNGHIGLSYSHVHIGPNAATMAWYTLLSGTNLPGNILGNLLPSKKTVQQSCNHSIEGRKRNNWTNYSHWLHDNIQLYHGMMNVAVRLSHWAPQRSHLTERHIIKAISIPVQAWQRCPMRKSNH